MLESNLTRSTDLAFQTNLLYLDVSNSRVGIRTAAPGNFALDVNGTARFQNSVEISGDLTVTGTTTVVNTTNMEIEDNILLLNSGGSVGNDAGIMIKRQASGNNAAFYWDEGSDKFKIVTTTSDGSTVTNIDDTAYTRLAGADPVDNEDFVTLQSMNTAISIATSALNMTFVGDDSTGSTLSVNETLKIAGAQNISTAVLGDTVTITGPDLTPYVQKTDKSITVVGDDSTGTDINVGETFKIAGAQNITTAVSGDTVTITGPNLGTFSFSGNKITQTASNADFEMETAGTGNFVLSSTAGLILPKGTTAQRPSAQTGVIRFNNQTSKYEVCLDGSTWTALKTEATSKTVLKDVFTGDGSTQTFISANVTTAPENLIVYIDSVMQEPDLNYITDGSTSSITITDEAPHIGARIVVISGFADDLI